MTSGKLFCGIETSPRAGRCCNGVIALIMGSLPKTSRPVVTRATDMQHAMRRLSALSAITPGLLLVTKIRAFSVSWQFQPPRAVREVDCNHETGVAVITGATQNGVRANQTALCLDDNVRHLPTGPSIMHLGKKTQAPVQSGETFREISWLLRRPRRALMRCHEHLQRALLAIWTASYARNPITSRDIHASRPFLIFSARHSHF